MIHDATDYAGSQLYREDVNERGFGFAGTSWLGFNTIMSVTLNIDMGTALLVYLIVVPFC